MKTFFRSVLLGWVFALLAATAHAADARQQIVDGVAIYLGVLPSELILGHPQAHPEKEMHGGAARNRHHVVVALFDAGSGKRIGGATVKATVSPLGLSAQVKSLEPMRIAGTETYGNYFASAGAGPYRLQLEIAGIKGKGKIAAEFEYLLP